MHPEHVMLETSDNTVLGGRLILRQPLRGHRVGHDAILLAAATEAFPGEHSIDLGAGVGAAGLALAQRVPELKVTLVDIDPELSALAAFNGQRNGLSDRVRAVTLDVTDPDVFAAAGLALASADRLLMNPPFNDPARQNVSPDARRRLAHVGGPETLPKWVRAAASLLKPGGTLTLIWRADDRDVAIESLRVHFGSIAVLPVYPGPDASAIRILIRASKGGRAPVVDAVGITLNDSRGQPSTAAEAILRGEQTLSFSEIKAAN